MEVLIAILVALSMWLLTAAGRLVALARRHWMPVAGLASASMVIGVLVFGLQWGHTGNSADYAKGDAELRQLIANP